MGSGETSVQPPMRVPCSKPNLLPLATHTRPSLDACTAAIGSLGIGSYAQSVAFAPFRLTASTNPDREVTANRPSGSGVNAP